MPKHADLDTGHCYLFDRDQADDSYSYKAVGHECTMVATAVDAHLSRLAGEIKSLREQDQQFVSNSVELRDREERALHA